MPLAETSHIYLTKASDDLVSFCNCQRPLMTFPPQMDCPWCGCGWLFTCIECRKAFAFARGIVVSESWEETAARDLRNKWKQEPSADDVLGWVGAMQELLGDVRENQEYVCLDGLIIARDASAVAFDGWHSRHDLPYVPQVAALGDRSVLSSVLGSREYWKRTKLEAP